jgi:SAM-dependent methyltransferase
MDFLMARALAEQYRTRIRCLQHQKQFEPNQALEDTLRERYAYDAWPTGEPYEWGGTQRGDSPFDLVDHALDLGCGRVKKGRIGVDHFAAPGVDVVIDLDKLTMPTNEGMLDYPEAWAPVGRLPFADSSIESAVSHHCLEHVGTGFLRLMDEMYRVLKPGAVFRVIVPLFPSWAAVSDPDHKRYFMANEEGGAGTFDSFCGTPTNCWLDSFSVPYTRARFERVDQVATPRIAEPSKHWTARDVRELRVALKVIK